MAYGPPHPVGGTGTQGPLHAARGSAPSGSPRSVAPPPPCSTATFAEPPSVGWTDAPDAATFPGSPSACPSPGGVLAVGLEFPPSEVASAVMSLLSPAG